MKFWFQADGTKTMFKAGRPGTGENWSEKATCELAGLLGLPHAHYDLASWHDHAGNPVQGVITPSFVAPDARLVLGNEIIGPMVNTEAARERFYKQSYHTARLVMTVLASSNVKPPEMDPAFPFPQSKDMFVGYILFDAWIGNQDRHSENWGLIVSQDSSIGLAPTYDHASSLGRNESDEKRLIRLRTKDKGQSIDYYVTKATSALYKGSKDPKPLSTLDAFTECARHSPTAAAYWLDKLNQVQIEDVATIFTQIPRSFITEVAVEFAIKMLEINKKRLLDCIRL